MNEAKIGFVILHYINDEDTIECVNSIKKLNYNYTGIVIVDNHSDNHSGQYLNQYYQKDKRIKVVITKTNLGFAKANNIGIKICREYFDSDFVYVINNDIIFKEKDHLKKLINEYNKDVAVISPQVRKRNKQIFKGIPFCDSLSFYMLEQVLCIIKSFGLMDLSDMLEKKYIKQNKKLKDKIYQIPSGCALMFTPIFFKYYQGFYSGTFLYYEEQILKIMLNKINKKWIRVEETYLIHKEEASTKKNKNYNKFKYYRKSHWHVFLVKYFNMHLWSK